MALLHLTLLGGFEARAGDASPVVFPRKKAEALLAYLAVDPGEAHLRDELAALLWGESNDQRARHSLRQTLSALKQALGRNGGDVLRVDADTVAINRAAIRVNVDVLKQLVTETTPFFARVRFVPRILEFLGYDPFGPPPTTSRQVRSNQLMGGGDDCNCTGRPR